MHIKVHIHVCVSRLPTYPNNYEQMYAELFKTNLPKKSLLALEWRFSDTGILELLSHINELHLAYAQIPNSV